MSAASGYVDVLRRPHALALVVPNMVARSTSATVSLALLVTVRHATGTFGPAGLAVGLFGAANVCVAPVRARLVDRAGLRRGLGACALAFAAALVVTSALAALGGSPPALLVLSAGVVGLFPPPHGSAMRALWRDLCPDDADLARAFSVDSIGEEILFVSGPPAVALLMAATVPEAGLLLTAALTLIGTVAMIGSPLVRDHAGAAPEAGTRRPSLVRRRGVAPLLATLFAAGLVLGTAEVVVPFVAQQDHHPSLAGVLLGLLSVGSIAGGLAYGARSWSVPPQTRLRRFAVTFAVTCASLALAPAVAGLGVLLVLLGLFLAPTLITGYLLATELVPEGARTEAYTWNGSALNAGAAAGSVAAGFLASLGGATSAFLAAGGAAVMLVAVAATRT